MTITYGDGARQALINDVAILSESSVSGTLALARSTNFPGTSGFSYALDMAANANKSYVPYLSQRFNADGVVHLRCKIGISGDPSAPIAFAYGSASGSSPSSGERQYGRIETDRTITIRDKNNNQLWRSVALIPTAGSARIVDVFWDSLTLATVWVVVLIDNVLAAAFDSGLTRANFFTTSDRLYFGEPQPAGSNAGVTMYGADITVNYSTTAGDAPHLTQWRKPAIVGGVLPDTNGTYAEWPLGTGTGFGEIDEAPNDGDTTHWRAGGANLRNTVKSTVANPIPASWTPIGAWLEAVARLESGGKLFCSQMYRLAGTDANMGFSVSPGTSYVGVKGQRMDTAPAGGAWARSDFDASTLEWGVINAGTGSSGGSRVSQLYGPAILCYDASDLIQLTPTPAVAGQPILRRSAHVPHMALGQSAVRRRY